ncbi:Inner membrane protein YiaW [Roseimaritima multifibrata]|uniref:Inner membrane protein YiaW n=1 Tax=Roseimaritima multifibrata TaxID=1930274 RepID=A0A517MC21_9BACT|nr:DUF3302 domain-containing protein [Roseimaritima multifibrata]QDS92440.1 Inner membrane protein YiaW [Roseimaritima multifibrata]
MEIDKFDIMAFAVLGTFVVIGLVAIVTIGALPGKIAAKRGHPQASAINAASWMSLATLGALWPLAFVWAFLHQQGSERSVKEEAPE